MAFDGTPERWADIPECFGYRVSTFGRVGSRRRKNSSIGSFLSDYQELLTPTLSLGGYPCVNLQRHEKPWKSPIGNLVLLAFVGPKPSGMECRHLDGCKTNNRLDNLEWATHSENNKDIARHGHFVRSPKVPLAIKEEIRRRREAGERTWDLAIEFSLGESTIRCICKPKPKKNTA